MAPFTATGSVLSIEETDKFNFMLFFSGGQGVSKYLLIINSFYSNCFSDRSCV